MKSTEHAVAGAVVSAIGAIASGDRFSCREKILLWCYGVFLSVFIDLDHFVISRYKTGSWKWLFEALTNPKNAFAKPEWLFEDTEMTSERLLSHALIGGVLTILSFAIRPFLAVFTPIVVYTHVVCDLLRDSETV